MNLGTAIARHIYLLRVEVIPMHSFSTSSFSPIDNVVCILEVYGTIYSLRAGQLLQSWFFGLFRNCFLLSIL